MNDSIIQVRADRRQLATLLKYYNERGVRISSKSSLGRVIIEDLYHILVSNNIVQPIQFTNDATIYLERYFGGEANLNPDGRGLRNLKLNVLNQEQMMSEIEREAKRFFSQVNQPNQPNNQPSNQQIDESPIVETQEQIVERRKVNKENLEKKFVEYEEKLKRDLEHLLDDPKKEKKEE